MVADIERLENAARTAMGDYSLPVPQASSPSNGLKHLALAASKLASVVVRAFGKAA